MILEFLNIKKLIYLLFLVELGRSVFIIYCESIILIQKFLLKLLKRLIKVEKQLTINKNQNSEKMINQSQLIFQINEIEKNRIDMVKQLNYE